MTVADSFSTHRNTEEADGMFGTLVVTLPSTYRGGALRISHAGHEVTVNTNTVDPCELSYVAFYAGCEHEALPVREGNRICLVYNLLQKQSKTRHRLLKAPEYESQITEAAAILDRFLRAPEAPPKIAWPLDHRYRPGLSFSALKGAGAAKARVPVQAAARAQCAVHLGVVPIGESGAAEPEDDDSYRSSRNRNRNYHDEHEEDRDEDASFTVATVDDRVVEFGRIPITGGELLPAGALDREPPDEKRQRKPRAMKVQPTRGPTIARRLSSGFRAAL